jgi:hypothetical protein
MPIKNFPITAFDERIVNSNLSLFDYVEDLNVVQQIVYYVIDSKARKSLYLPSWIKEQVEFPSEKLLDIASKIKEGKTHDETVVNVLTYVVSNVKWTSDKTQWDADEKWATANEIVAQTKTPFKDDCDGGATLIYVLCRLKGIPANRLLFMTGQVQASPTAPQEGHAWLAFRPNAFPLNWVFLDWCYNPNLNSTTSRPLFYINKKEILGHDECYKSLWFAFNENKSYLSLR